MYFKHATFTASTIDHTIESNIWICKCTLACKFIDLIQLVGSWSLEFITGSYHDFSFQKLSGIGYIEQNFISTKDGIPLREWTVWSSSWKLTVSWGTTPIHFRRLSKVTSWIFWPSIFICESKFDKLWTWGDYIKLQS